MHSMKELPYSDPISSENKSQRTYQELNPGNSNENFSLTDGQGEIATNKRNNDSF